MREALSNDSANSNSKIDDATIKMPSEKKSPFNVRDKEILGEGARSTKSHREIEGDANRSLPKLQIDKKATSPVLENCPVVEELASSSPVSKGGRKQIKRPKREC